MKIFSAMLIICLSFIVAGCSFFRNEYPVPQFNRGVLLLQTEKGAPYKSYLSYLDTVGNSLTNNLFTMQNKADLGNGANSMVLYNGRGYVIMTGEDRIAVLQGNTLEQIGVIQGETVGKKLIQCRYFAPVDEQTAYVTCWGDNFTPPYVAIVDLNSLQVTGIISLNNNGLGKKPETIVVKGNFAYVAISDANTVALINISSSVVKFLEVGNSPTGMVIDQLQQVWVLNNDPIKSLRIIDTNQVFIPIAIQLPTNSRLGNLTINQTRDVLYFSITTPNPKSDSIYRFPIATKIKNSIAQQVVEKMKIDPNTNMLYVSGTSSSHKGYILRYKLPAATVTGAVSRTDSIAMITSPVDFIFQPKAQ